MGLYGKIITTSFKSNAAYKFNFYMSTFFGFIMLVLKISIWQALFAARGEASLSGVSLSDMIAYNVIVAFSRRFVSSDVMNDINDMAVNGEIAQRLLLPLGFRRHLFLSTLSSGAFWTLYSAIPPTLAAVAIYGLRFSFEPANLVFFLISLLLAMIIGFLLDFTLGIVVFWFKNAFFLDWMRGAFFSLFSGSFVPMWFFPDWLNTLGRFLPFRYIVYEPTAILLGKDTMAGTLEALCFQLAWILLLFLLGEFVWRRAQKLIFSQGG